MLPEYLGYDLLGYNFSNLDKNLVMVFHFEPDNFKKSNLPVTISGQNIISNGEAGARLTAYPYLIEAKLKTRNDEAAWKHPDSDEDVVLSCTRLIGIEDYKKAIFRIRMGQLPDNDQTIFDWTDFENEIGEIESGNDKYEGIYLVEEGKNWYNQSCSSNSESFWRQH